MSEVLGKIELLPNVFFFCVLWLNSFCTALALDREMGYDREPDLIMGEITNQSGGIYIYKKDEHRNQKRGGVLGVSDWMARCHFLSLHDNVYISLP